MRLTPSPFMPALRVLLMKLHEIQRAVELELRSCKVEAPLAWRTAFDEAGKKAAPFACHANFFKLKCYSYICLGLSHG